MNPTTSRIKWSKNRGCSRDYSVRDRERNPVKHFIEGVLLRERIHPVAYFINCTGIRSTTVSTTRLRHTLAYKVRSTGSPAYLLPSVSDYVPTRNLRSSSQYLLIVPAVRTQIARRAFSHAASSVWKKLPVNIRRSESFSRFRTQIRTLYFRLAFIDWSSRDCLAPTIRPSNVYVWSVYKNIE